MRDSRRSATMVANLFVLRRGVRCFDILEKCSEEGVEAFSLMRIFVDARPNAFGVWRKLRMWNVQF